MFKLTPVGTSAAVLPALLLASTSVATPPQGLSMPKAVLPPSALNDRIAIPPPVPACPQ
jgi:hypothetical protein